MSILHFKSRPWTVFDPANKQHRRWYYEFVKHKTWGKCPVRFIVPEDHGDLITMCQRALVRWYVDNEFRNVAKKQHSSVSQKRKKTVDKLANRTYNRIKLVTATDLNTQ